MSRKQDRLTSRPRPLTSHYSTPSVFSSLFGNSYKNSYNNYTNYSPNSYRNYNPYSSTFGRSTSGIYGGTSSGYGGVYLGSLNISPVLKNLDKKLLASQKNFRPKEIITAKAPTVRETPEPPPVRPERKSKAAKAARSHSFNKERSRSLCSLNDGVGLSSRSLSLNSLASDGYYSGSERTVGPTSDDGEPDYKALYEASAAEVRTLRDLLNTSEQQLRDARSTITRLTQLEQNSMSEVEKRERRAMERKLSEMEEELKQLQKLKAENERLRAENRALTRVVSKLTNTPGK